MDVQVANPFAAQGLKLEFVYTESPLMYIVYFDVALPFANSNKTVTLFHALSLK